MAEKTAVRLFNKQEGHLLCCVYGLITTGSVWRFLKLQSNDLFIDKQEYFIDNLRNLLGILIKIVAKPESYSCVDFGKN